MPYAVLTIPDFSLHALRRSDPSEPKTQNPKLKTPSPSAEIEAQRLLLAAAFTLSPRVEATAAGTCTVDLQGADAASTESAIRARIAELARAGLPVRAGAGATPLLAAYAARIAEPLLIVREPREFLQPLPLAFASPTPAHAEILGSWGLHTLGDLLALAKGDIGDRLGPGGAALWERAAGGAPRPLLLIEPAKSFSAEWGYDPPVETIEPLVFKLRRFSERIALELRAAGFVAEALALTLFLEDETDRRREFRLPEPGADVDSWLRVLQTHLDTVRTAARVAGVRLCATPARPPVKQGGLFDTGLRDPAAFWENLARLGALVGDGHVGTPVVSDTHKPDSFTLEKPAAFIPEPAPPPLHPPRGLLLRRFRPPLTAEVTLKDPETQNPKLRTQNSEPKTLNATPVRAAAGPWLASTAWWTAAPCILETWQVELATGTVYQLSRTADAWFLEGVLD